MINHTRNVQFDYLRSVIAYLGIILHAIVLSISIYIATHPGQTSLNTLETLLGGCGVGIYLFRMGLFFIIAGYFAHYQLSTRALPIYLIDRFKRIAIPLVIIFLLFNLPQIFIVLFNYFTQQKNVSYQQLNDLSYLWFLYYLLIFYAITLLFKLIKSLFALNTAYLTRSYQWLIHSPFKPLFFTIFTILITLNNTKFLYPTTHSFIPNTHSVFFYFIFYAFGYLLSNSKNVLSLFSPYCFVYLILGVALLPLVAQVELPNLLLGSTHQSNISIPSPIANVLHHLASWLFVFGLLGLFSYCNKQNKVILYLAKSSYWVYLSHYPILLTLVPYFYLKTESLALTFIYSSVTTTVIILVTYQAWRVFLLIKNRNVRFTKPNS